jgi:hypothetical protein
MKMFGLLEVNREFDGIRFAIGLRNVNDKSMHVGMVAGYRVFVCDNTSFQGDFNPMLQKHSKTSIWLKPFRWALTESSANGIP